VVRPRDTFFIHTISCCILNFFVTLLPSLALPIHRKITTAYKIMVKVITILLVFYFLISFVVLAYLLYKRRRKLSYRLETRLASLEVEALSGTAQILNKVKDQRVRISIELNGRGTSYNSLLLEAKHLGTPPTLLIDSLFPKEGNELIQYSDFIKVDFSVLESGQTRQNIPYSFTATFIQGENLEGYPAFRISYPEEIKREQKREYMRISPSVNEPLYITFDLEGKKTSEKIANISAGGVGFYTNLDKDVLWPDRKFGNVFIDLPGSVVIQCLVIVYTLSKIDYPVLIDNKPYHHYCGAQFVDIEKETREKLVNYILEQERNALKRINRFG